MRIGKRLAALTGSLAVNWGYGALLATAFLVPVPLGDFTSCACTIVEPEPMAHAYVQDASRSGDRPVAILPITVEYLGIEEAEDGNRCPAGPVTDRQALLLTDVAIPESKAQDEGWPSGINRLCILIDSYGRIEQAFAVEADRLTPSLRKFTAKVRREWRFDPPAYQGRKVRTWQRLVIVGPRRFADLSDPGKNPVYMTM
jgi:hypothetical protein